MDVVYIYTGTLEARAAIVSGISELIHAERDYTLSATIPEKYRAVPGEYLGFRCIDGRFRLFLIDRVDGVEEDGTTEITATDAAVAELNGSVARGVTLDGKTAEEAVREIIAGTGFELGTVTTGSETGTGKYAYIKRWPALKRVAENLDVRIIPYYTIEGARITGRRVDVLKKERVYRGRFFESGRDAEGVIVSHIGAPVTVLYGVGKVTGQSETERVTIAGVSWSRARGDPVDKPEGQDYVEDMEAIARWGRREDVYQDDEEEDAGRLQQKTWAELQKRKQPEISAQATISDMEDIPGQEHKAVWLWDYVIVGTRKYGNIEAEVIAIKRDYIRKDKTKLTLGREDGAAGSKAGLVSQIAALSRETSIISARGQATTNKSIYNDSLIQLNANAIQMNAETIMAQAELIDLRATKEQVEDLEEGVLSRFSEVAITLDAYKAQIDLMATREEVTEVEERVSKAEIKIDGANAAIALKADQTIVTEQENKLGELEKVTTQLGAELTVQAGQISSKVSKDGVISTINQSPEAVTINANRINLSGYVTASRLSAIEAELSNLSTGVTQASLIYTKNLEATNVVRLAGHTLDWRRYTVVNSFTQASGETQNGENVVLGVALLEAVTTTYTPSAGTTITF